MNRRSALLIGALFLALGLSGCQGKTPEEIEAAKYPKAQPLTPEEEAQARQLTQTRPRDNVAPSNPPPTNTPR